MAKNKTPKPPGYDKVTKAIKKSSKASKKQADKQLDWAKDFYKEADALNKDVIADLDLIRENQLQAALNDQKRLDEVFEPLEDEQISEINAFQGRVSDFDEEVQKLKDEATAWKSEANQKYQAGKAQASVTQAFSQEKQAAERALLDAGVNPNSGASMTALLGANLAEGAAKAAAGTTAADATRTEGDAMYQAALDRQVQATEMADRALQLQGGMVDVGRGYVDAVTKEAGLAATVGAQGLDQTMAVADAYNKAKALGLDWSKMELDALKTWTDTINTGFTNELDLYNAETDRITAEAQADAAEAQQSSGIGGALGAVGAVVKAFVNKGGLVPAYAKGGAVDVDEGGSYSPTGPTANSAAPAVGDEADVTEARLTPGEFVIPRRVVEWKGEEFFQNLIDKLPQKKQELIASTGATPKMKAVPQGAVAI